MHNHESHNVQTPAKQALEEHLGALYTGLYTVNRSSAAHQYYRLQVVFLLVVVCYLSHRFAVAAPRPD